MLLAFWVPQASAQDDSAAIRVSNVKFNNNVNPTRASNMVVQLRPQANNDPQARNKDYVDNIRVVVTLGYGDPQAADFTCYRSEVTIATMRVGQQRAVAFWLPSEIVERDRLNREPNYWIVELFVNGQQITANRDQVSSSLMRGNPQEMLNGFKATADSRVAQTEGILLPTYLTNNPEVDRPDRVPAYIRKDNQQ